MYARRRPRPDPVWRRGSQNFFQYLTQAATKVTAAAIVASLLARTRRKRTRSATRSLNELSDDLPPAAGRDGRSRWQRGRGRGAAAAVLQAGLDPRPRGVPPARGRGTEGHRGARRADEEGGQSRRGPLPEELPVPSGSHRFLYAKWTNLERFQRTRGVLRTFALGLRDAEKWDDARWWAPTCSCRRADKDRSRGGRA